MPTSPVSCGYDYRAAIALNNYGVSLLARGAFDDAVETLKDAVTIMKFEYPCYNSHALRGHGITEMVLRAQKRVAAATLNDPSPSEIEIFDVVFSSVDISSLQHALPRGPGDSTFYPIRIDLPFPDDFDDRDLDLESAVLLNNFGISHICISRTHPDLMEREVMRSAALQIFSLTHSILVRESQCLRFGIQQTCLLLISAVSLMNIIAALSSEQTSDTSEALETLSRLHKVLNGIHHSQPDLFFVRYGNAAGAA